MPQQRTNKLKEFAVGIRVDYLLAAVTALRERANAAAMLSREEGDIPPGIAQNTYDWEAANVIEAAVTAATKGSTAAAAETTGPAQDSGVPSFPPL